MEQRCVLIELGNTTFGVPLRLLASVEPLTRIVPLPNVPPWLLGLTYRRGLVLSVIDLAAVLHRASQPIDSATSRLLIVHDGAMQVAFATPTVSEVRVIAAEQVQPAPPAGSDPASRYVSGVVANGDAPFSLLDLGRLLRSPEFLTLAALPRGAFTGEHALAAGPAG